MGCSNSSPLQSTVCAPTDQATERVRGVVLAGHQEEVLVWFQSAQRAFWKMKDELLTEKTLPSDQVISMMATPPLDPGFLGVTRLTRQPEVAPIRRWKTFWYPNPELKAWCVGIQVNLPLRKELPLLYDTRDHFFRRVERSLLRLYAWRPTPHLNPGYHPADPILALRPLKGLHSFQEMREWFFRAPEKSARTPGDWSPSGAPPRPGWYKGEVLSADQEQVKFRITYLTQDGRVCASTESHPLPWCETHLQPVRNPASSGYFFQWIRDPSDRTRLFQLWDHPTKPCSCDDPKQILRPLTPIQEGKRRWSLL